MLGEFDQRNVRKLTKSREISRKDLAMENSVLLMACLGICQCLVASCMHVYYAVKYDVGNRNLGMSAANSRGNIWEFHNT